MVQLTRVVPSPSQITVTLPTAKSNFFRFRAEIKNLSFAFGGLNINLSGDGTTFVRWTISWCSHWSNMESNFFRFHFWNVTGKTKHDFVDSRIPSGSVPSDSRLSTLLWISVNIYSHVCEYLWIFVNICECLCSAAPPVNIYSQSGSFIHTFVNKCEYLFTLLWIFVNICECLCSAAPPVNIYSQRGSFIHTFVNKCEYLFTLLWIFVNICE